MPRTQRSRSRRHDKYASPAQHETALASRASSIFTPRGFDLGQSVGAWLMWAARMSIKGWIWKSVIAGLSGTIVHFAFMYLRSRLGLLPSFQPYQAFKRLLVTE